MGQFIIRGGRALRGDISVSGSKNSALPIIFSCILLRGKSTITNLPNISDVKVALRILELLGATVTEIPGGVTVDSENLQYADIPECLTSKIRASTYLLGAMLGRFGRCRLEEYGGCNFDLRPIDMHVYAAECVGARQVGCSLFADGLRGGNISFNKISVGATVNAILLTATATGESRIYGYAREPHVMSLIDFLRSAGACIEVTEECIIVEGRELSSGKCEIIGDMIEAGTYISLSLMTGAELSIYGADRYHLSSFIDALIDGGAVFEFGEGYIRPRGRIWEEMRITAEPYPAFPTDLQPETAPLMARYMGGSITDKVWRRRFGYLGELEKFGVEYELCENSAYIKPSAFHPARATAPDLRGGIALVMCALAADGESIVDNSEVIKRGYESIADKLRSIGADIEEK